jgi:hypothetical protein
VCQYVEQRERGGRITLEMHLGRHVLRLDVDGAGSGSCPERGLVLEMLHHRVSCVVCEQIMFLVAVIISSPFDQSTEVCDDPSSTELPRPCGTTCHDVR